MRVVIYYEAFDGARFENEVHCIEHELKLKLAGTDLRIYKGNEILKDLLSVKTHNECTRVVIPNENALNDIKMIKKFNGCYLDIDAVGTWEYDYDTDEWMICN